MDYPISVPSVGLVGGKFVDEDPLAGTPGSLIPAQWGNAVTDEIIGVIASSGLTPDELNNTQLKSAIYSLISQRQSAGGALVGGLRNCRLSITAASTSAVFTADEVLVKPTLGGAPWVLSSVNKPINLAGVGVGGMDAGLAPVSGFVSIYVIYNSTTQASGLLACAQATSSGAIYSGANMPAGYNSSALVSSWRTNASRQFVTGYQSDRKVFFAPTQVISSTTQQAALTALSISAAVPTNARSVDVVQQATVSANGFSFVAAGDSIETGTRSFIVNSSGTQGVALNEVPLITSQTIYYRIASAGTLTAFSISVTSYTF